MYVLPCLRVAIVNANCELLNIKNFVIDWTNRIVKSMYTISYLLVTNFSNQLRNLFSVIGAIRKSLKDEWQEKTN